MKNFDLVQMLITAFKLVGEQPLVDILQSLYVSNPSMYGAAIALANYGLSEAEIAAAKTTTTIDDSIVAAVKEVIKTSADKNSVVLL